MDINLSDFPALEPPERILLGPGPCMAEPAVLQALATPLIGHLDPEFITIMNRTQALLRHVFQTENALTIPISGTGSASMEAAVANVVEPGDKMLICANGYFGHRLEDMALRYGAEVHVIHRPWGQVFDPEEVETALNDFPAQIVAIVHAETSTGALQPLEDIACIVHERDALLIVDAVTSLAGAPLKVDEWGIDVCYSGAQKCLSIPPGISPLTLNQRAADKLANRTSKVPNWYLDLSMLTSYWGDDRTYHHTAPISMNYALYAGLRVIVAEGLENRWRRHRENAERLWDGLEALGLSMHVDLDRRAPPLTTVKISEAVDGNAVRARLLNEYNIEISGGLGELKGKVWRIGLMGYSSRAENVDALLDALRDIL